MTDLVTLSDRLELTELHHRYSHHIDESEYDDLLTLFSPTAEVTFIRGGRTDVYRSPDEIRALYSADKTKVRHLMTNLIIKNLTETSAQSRSYVAVSAREEKGFVLRNTVVYDGELEKSNDGWQIVRWTITAD